jgi:hypothetical protein
MLTVKKITAGQTYGQYRIDGEKSVVWVNRTSTFAVVDENGNVVFTRNRLTNKWQPENYDRKYVAKKQAEYINNHSEKETTTFPVKEN